MNWFKLSDEERLCRYADEVCDRQRPSFPVCNEEDTYFIDVKNCHAGHIPDLMRYEPVTVRGLREKFNLLWQDNSLPDSELLIKICCTAALKNEPYPLNYDRLLYEWKLTDEIQHSSDYSKKNLTYSINKDNCPTSDENSLISVLVYEF